MSLGVKQYKTQNRNAWTEDKKNKGEANHSLA
jgi:hypothetical protein